MTKGKRTRQFSMEFKDKAIARVTRGEKMSALARDIGITTGLLSAWVKQGIPNVNNPSPSETSIPGRIKDAIIYLRHARDTMNPKTTITRGELLVLLARVKHASQHDLAESERLTRAI